MHQLQKKSWPLFWGLGKILPIHNFGFPDDIWLLRLRNKVKHSFYIYAVASGPKIKPRNRKSLSWGRKNLQNSFVILGQRGLSSTPLIGNMLIDPCTSVDDKNSTEAIRMCGLFLSSLPRSMGSTCLNNSYNWAAQTVGREAGHRDQKSAVRYTSLPSSAEPVAFHLELLGDGRQGNNQHRNGAFAFTQDQIEHESLKAET